MAAVGGEHIGVLAHIAGVPVEEWLPFLVPIVALYLYGRRRERRRRAAASDLPAAEVALPESAAAAVLEAWREAGYAELRREHLPLLRPPGPDGVSAAALSGRAGAGGGAAVERLLDELEELGYVETEEGAGDAEGRRAWLTLKGYALVDVTEDALIGALARGERPRQTT